MLIVRDGKSELTNIYEEVKEIENHIHNREKWFGDGATLDSLTPYTIVSGNGAFGAEVLLLDVANTPVDANMLYFDLHRVLTGFFSEDTVYYLRLIWGTGTVAAAETAKQYSTIPIFSNSTLPTKSNGTPSEIIFPRLPIKTKVWAKIKNTTNLSTMQLWIGLHEYAE